MNIGDLFLRILADDLGFKADVVKKATDAGDAAGLTLGQRMGAAVKANGAKIIGAIGGLAGGIAIAGLKELRDIEAEFRAETGATADEAARAGKAILAMSAHNIQGLEEIGKTLTRVYTDLHLTGDAAAAATQQFLTFGRATGQNAVEAVGLFADILHAWNLTADKSGEIMDALVVSHQRYGTVIADNEAALAALAPALIAANETWRDGLALLNLFKESGVDSAVAITAMTKALAKVHSPEELKALLDDIIATEDPFLRAAKASDLFGAKAGPKLANVLKPGINGLDDYAISTTDAAGATQKAADVLDATWGARFQLLIKQAGAAIIGFGNDWNGAATVITTAGSAIGAVGGGKLLGPLTAGLKGAWTKVATSAVVTRAVAFAAGKAATIYLAGLIAGDAIGGVLEKAWLATGARLLAAAGISGAAAGRAFALGAAAAIVAAPAAVIIVAIQVGEDIRRAKSDFAAQVDAVIKDGTLEGLKSAKAAIEAQIGSEKILGIIPFEFGGEVTAMKEQLGKIDAAIAGLEKTVPPAIATVTTASATLGTKGGRGFASLASAATAMTYGISRNAGSIKAILRGLTATLLAEATAMINGYYDPIIAQDDLRVQKDQVAADTVARNATKAGTAARHQADLTLANSKKNLDQTRLNLLAAGTLSAKEQKAWLTELQKKYKTATGAAKKNIGELIDYIHQLQGTTAPPIDIVVSGQKGGARKRAWGGPVKAGEPYLVNENTPNSEIWVPDVSGRVRAPSATPASAMAANVVNNYYNTATVEGIVKAKSPLDIARELGRFARNGQFVPREPTG